MIPDDPTEWKALASRQLPLPFFETHFALGRARAIMAATRLGVFESLRDGAATPTEIARRCQIDATATQKLLVVLAGSDYLLYRDGRYALTPDARTWLLKDSPSSMVDVVLFAFDEWELMTHVEDYLRTGVPLGLQQSMTGTQWANYQRFERAQAALTAREIAQVIPVPSGATDMIDIGGSHGQFSVALCQRYSSLRSVVLDSPEAQALAHDFGEDNYDVVLLCNRSHHFSAAGNALLFRRLGRALRPRGVFAVIQPIAPQTGDSTSQFAALNELYLGAISRCGPWSARETAGWQRDAGLRPAAEPIILSGGEVGVQIATKI
ncbi:hypothetical protein A5647_24540 [Mycobacterium sp. 1100029.7]|nr:hypothetical protein A5647_24540 [Mycobacterium sp. 1100029.7]